MSEMTEKQSSVMTSGEAPADTDRHAHSVRALTDMATLQPARVREHVNNAKPLLSVLENFARPELRRAHYQSAALTDWQSQILPSCFLSTADIKAQTEVLRTMPTERYHQEILSPVEQSDRYSVVRCAKYILETVHDEVRLGPLYFALGETEQGGQKRMLAILAQNRYEQNGVWGAEHHHEAIRCLQRVKRARIPLITFIDTPGAAANTRANQSNQAHSISALIAAMAELHVPTVGIIWGAGYSGGAIPLATTNVLLSVRDGLFNTIQPQGLASIARKQRLSWQACAQIAGVSAIELHQQGVVDAVVDYSPLQQKKGLRALWRGIEYALQSIDKASASLVQNVGELRQYYGSLSLSPMGENAVGTQPDEITHLRNWPVASWPSLYESAYRLHRSIVLRNRLRTSSYLEHKDETQNPKLSEDSAWQQLSDIQQQRFDGWRQRQDKLAYEERLSRLWTEFLSAEKGRSHERNYVATLLWGTPEDSFVSALHNVLHEISFLLYSQWQQDASALFGLLEHTLKTQDTVKFSGKGILNKLSHVLENANIQDNTAVTETDNATPEAVDTIQNLVCDRRIAKLMIEHCRHMVLFDRVYEAILARLTDIVTAMEVEKRIPAELMLTLLNAAGISEKTDKQRFAQWLMTLKSSSALAEYLQTIEQWKRVQHPRLAPVIFVVATYFFERLFPEFFKADDEGKGFTGHFQPASIGRRKDFWNQLNHATQDLRIQAVLNTYKPGSNFQPEYLIQTFFSRFAELDRHINSANPVKFPGFGKSLEQARKQGKNTAGLISGIAALQTEQGEREIGLFVSNHGFQAGAFDMASAERFCRLLAYCAQSNLPVVGFVCSGGMQTKEGAAALFSMAVVNDAINRFVQDLDLPILMFGYGDCTGGAQASLVTHPLVDTYYFSGTNMPFAGRIVVPEYLPVLATLSNYLVVPNPEQYRFGTTMNGLVKNPFAQELDDELRLVDPDIRIPYRTVEEVLGSWLADRVATNRVGQDSGLDTTRPALRFDHFDKVLIHARGCTASKLVAQAHQARLQVVLVQSDPDMDSVAADLLNEDDELVCLGGFTPDESYLNGHSVIRIAELYGAQALHPGIGFLSENHEFAQSCLQHGLVFVGPSPDSMAQMGDKARAIQTAIDAGVPVVPGSHGILKDEEHAEKEANRIGYPVILKAVHGGGGKGIAVVESESQLKPQLQLIKNQARSAFGRDEVYLERYVTRFRHIEVQLLRDRFGCTRVIGLRDCSVQREKQKIIEESASTLLPENLKKLAMESAARLADAAHYTGAGTVEFIFDLDRQALYFMEMNTRLQVEHPVTEAVTGVNLVNEQFRIAMGKSIDELQIGEKGYAIEVRVNAESVRCESGGFKVVPSPGHVTRCDVPERPWLKQIMAIGSDKSVSPYYDNLLAQLIVHGDDRQDAVNKMLDVLEHTVLEGVESNIELLKVILKDDVFLGGDYDTHYLPDLALRLMEQGREDEVTVVRASQTDNQQNKYRIDGSEELRVLAPMTAIVYRSPSPGKPDFVQEGDVIEVKQTLCLLEVMKMFQPFKLETLNTGESGLFHNGQFEVVHIKVEDGQQVNQGDLLFVVKPISATPE